MRHGDLNAGAPSVDFPKGLAALIKPALLIGGLLGRILKAGELAVALGRLHRASPHIRTFAADGEVKSSLQLGYGGRGRDRFNPFRATHDQPCFVEDEVLQRQLSAAGALGWPRRRHEVDIPLARQGHVVAATIM